MGVENCEKDNSEVMTMNKIKHIVYTTDVAECGVLEQFDCDKVSALDSRSAVYMATGMAAQNKETVLVFIKSNNASRSAFSGMTEAYYRNLPVALVTIGRELDYSRELRDVINSHFVVSNVKEIEELLGNEMPMHVEVDEILDQTHPMRSQIDSILGEVLSENDYLYTSSYINLIDDSFKCKVVHGGLPGCKEGSLANVLGASLAKKRKRYIGFVSEEEFFHDMNTLGNININDSLLYIISCKRENQLIKDFAESLGFSFSSFSAKNITSQDIQIILSNGRKSLLAIVGD